MKNKLIIIFALISFNCSAQLNEKILQSSLFQVGAGFADGTNQAYLFHNHGQFGKIKPNSEAWINKWALDENGKAIVGKERFWQSSRALVFTTDFHHFTRFTENRFNEASILTYAIGHGAKKKKWYWYFADLGIMFASRSAGFYASYEIVFK